MSITVCIPTKNKNDLDVEKLNLDVLGDYKVIVDDSPGLANSRTRLMEKVKTEWFVFIDDDVRINKDWWNKLRRYMNDDTVGAVGGLAHTKSKAVKFIRKILLRLRGDKVQRGFTSNTLIRTAAVKGIKLERQGRLEDLELQEKIRENGYEWILCEEAECEHLKSGLMVIKEGFGDFKKLVKERGFIRAVRTI